jgi:4-diphosphocytidyl-2-C-methyl-D-erythritol kinase
MTCSYFAPAKINLWLRVFRSDATGYHALDTLFCAIDLSDRIEIAAGAEGIHLHVHGADLGPSPGNLAYRAAQAYYHELGLVPAVSITLHKTIPAGAGLGGGSSDAAAVLRGLQELHEQRLPEQDLLAMAARLGSDVPFFFCGAPLAHAIGRGEVLVALPAFEPRSVLVLMPPFAIATNDAYRWLDESGTLQDRRVVISRHPEGWHDVERVAVNDFEPVLFARYPQLEDLRDALRASGADITMLSGSGSAVFGVFSDARQAERARAELAGRFADVAIHTARTLV